MNEYQNQKNSEIDFKQVLKGEYVCSKLQINPDSYLLAYLYFINHLNYHMIL